MIAAHLCSACRYLEGMANKPTTINIHMTQASVQDISLPPEPTPWTSRTSSEDEWEICNTWTMGLLIYKSTLH